MKSIVLPFLFAVVIQCAAAADAAFDCVITSDRTSYTIGDVPNITFRITNKSTKEVVLIGSLDGSTTNRRFPRCHFEVLDPNGNPVTLPLSLCGNMNPLKAKDFVVVPAGESFNPFDKGFFSPHQLHRFPVTVPGDYTLRFSYSTSDRIQDYSGDERINGQTAVTPEIQRLFERVPKIDIKSNELKITFTAQSE